MCVRVRACARVLLGVLAEGRERNRRGHRPQPPSQLYFVTVFHWGRPAPAGRLNDKKFVFPVIPPRSSRVVPTAPGVAALIFLGYPAETIDEPRCAREKTKKCVQLCALQTPFSDRAEFVSSYVIGIPIPACVWKTATLSPRRPRRRIRPTDGPRPFFLAGYDRDATTIA